MKRTKEAASRLPLLQRIVEFYKGDLLSGNYEDWAIGEQNRCRTAYREALALLTEALEESGDLAAALAAAQRMTEADPYEEAAYRAQMRLHRLLDRPAAALEVYRHLERLYQKEMGAQPSPETRALAEHIRNDPRARPPISGAKPRPAAPPPRTPVAAVPAEAVSSPTPDLLAPPLPLQLTRLVGREGEREDLCQRLLSPEIRLVTLLGTGGVGKTRLSVAVAEQVLPAFAGRVWFVSLAEAPHPSFISYMLLNALRLPPSNTVSDPFERVVEALGTRPCLLVLDNFEHLLREAPGPDKSDQVFAGSGPALVRLLLARVPGLVILTTSRQALRLAGEQEFALSPLPVPAADILSAEVLLDNASVALFTERARAVKPDFNLSDGNCAPVATICRMLEGVPLAIEMAAAWIRTLSPQSLMERLDKRLNLLVSRQRDLPARHRSLRATIEWSFDLLRPELRDFFACLGVFRGGWPLEAAEAICDPEALEALLELQERSLVLMEEREGETRYRLLEPLREFAVEQLQATQRWEAARQSHAAYFLAFAEAAEPKLLEADQGLWLNKLEADHDNLRVAMEGEDKETSLRIAGALWRFWDIHSHFSEGRRRLRAALEATAKDAYSAARTKALNGAGVLALRQGDYPNARMPHEECLTVSRGLGHKRGIANALGNLGIVVLEQGDYAAARTLQEECLAICRELGHKRGIATTLGNLGNVVIQLGDYAAAQRLFEEGLVLNREFGDQWSAAANLHGLGTTALLQEDYAAARTLYGECLVIMREMGDKSSVLSCLNGFASLAVKEPRAERAVRLISAVSALREAIGASSQQNTHEEEELEMTIARDLLGEKAFTAAWDAGSAMTLEEAIQYALVEE